MKKITVIIAALILAAATFCSCSNSTPDSTDSSYTTDDGTSSDEGEEIDFSIFPEIAASSTSIDSYRAEVINRLSDDVFIRNSEWEVIEKYLPETGMGEETLVSNNTYVTAYNHLFDTTSRYYYPVVFRENETLVLWYTTESGSVLFKGLNYRLYNRGNVGGFAHHDSPTGEVTLERVPNYALTYSQETGKVSKWEFGKLVESYSVPKNSIYCGISTFEGIIFRNGTDVYSLNAAADTYNADGSVVCIAHNVEYVIDADYQYGSDPWCQPLFLMTDGSIKAYIGWEGNQEVPDDPSHLCDLIYEGSWDK